MLVIANEQLVGVPRLLLYRSRQLGKSIAKLACYSRFHRQSFWEWQCKSRAVFRQCLLRQWR